MLIRTLISSVIVAFILVSACIGIQQREQQRLSHPLRNQHAISQQEQLPWSPGYNEKARQSHAVTVTWSALSWTLQRAARTLLSTSQQRPNTTSPTPAGNTTSSSSSRNGNRNGNGGSESGINVDSAVVPPTLNPAILNVTQPPTPAPAPTSAAAAEAKATAQPWTGPSVLKVSEVKAGQSCVCWTADWCTCGLQSCPYKPPDAAAQLPESAKELFGADVLPNLQASHSSRASRRAPPLSDAMLQRFNKRISTQLINPLYQFTTEHYVLEGAKEVVAAGGDSYKFNLANLDARGRAISNVKTPLDMVRSPSLPYADVFEQPLSMYFMWVFPNYSKPYEETYELAKYFLQRYQGTGKQFFIGMWEGDHALRVPGKWGHHVPPDAGRMEVLQYVLKEKQRAVDDAKRDAGDCQHVYVWNYIEANFVLDSIWNRDKISIVNFILPSMTNPPVDYISYSAYEVLFSGDWKLTNLTAAFDYMAQRMPDKPGVPGPRVFLGEWAYPMFDPQGRKAWTMEQSREKGLYAAAVAIAWGSQFNQYWQLYSNHRFSNNTGDRGFWLILPNREDSPIWTSMKDYFAASDEFLKRFWACYGGWPSDYTYRVWAVKTLMKLVNNATKPEPVVRDLSGTNYGQQARQVADNTFGNLGPTITFKPSGRTPADAAGDASSYIQAPAVMTPPMVPEYLPNAGERGNCPIPLPMLPEGVPRPSPAPASASAGGNATRPGNGTALPAGNSTAATTSNRTGPAAINATGQSRPTMLLGPNSTKIQEEAGKTPGSARGTEEKCEAHGKVSDKLQLKKEQCPFTYPRLSLEDIASGKSRAYTYGGIDRLGCANCQQKGLWPRFCLWRRTELPIWDSINCNQRESTGRSSVQRNLELAVDISRHWPASSGISVSGLSTQQMPPGPADITPCDVFRLIRGRTLWIIGDSQMKGLYTALKCFMLEFWDLKQYSPTWNTTTIDYFNKLPRNAEAKCIHLPESTRICQLKVLWADAFVEKPSVTETRWTVPVWEILQRHLASPEDIFALNFGLWYDPKNPRRYHSNMQSLGEAFRAARNTFPNMFFVETVKLHWPDPPGDQDGPRTVEEAGGMEQCKPTENIKFDPKTSQLVQKVTQSDSAALQKAAGQLEQLEPVFYKQKNSSSSSSSSSLTHSNRRHKRRLHSIAAAALSSQYGSVEHSTKRLLQWLEGRRLDAVGGGMQRSVLQQTGASSTPSQPGSQEAAKNSSAGCSAQATNMTSVTGMKGPVEDSPIFPVAANIDGASVQENRRKQQQQQQQERANQTAPVQGSSNTGSTSSSTSNNTTMTKNISEQTARDQKDLKPLERQSGSSSSGTGSRSSSDGRLNSGHGNRGEATGAAFPLLRPSFGVNSTKDESSISRANSSSSSSTTTAGNKPGGPPTPSSSQPLANATSSMQGAQSKPGNVPSNSSRTDSTSKSNSTTGPQVAGAAGSRPVIAPGFGSVTLPPELATQAVLSGLWRNQIARSVLRDRFSMPFVPIYNATVPAYWGHRHSPDAPDCIHYCNPGAPQNWMAKLMLAIAANTKPLEGQVADKRCLWGTQVVYDEGEKDFQ